MATPVDKPVCTGMPARKQNACAARHTFTVNGAKHKKTRPVCIPGGFSDSALAYYGFVQCNWSTIRLMICLAGAL